MNFRLLAPVVVAATMVLTGCAATRVNDLRDHPVADEATFESLVIEELAPPRRVVSVSVYDFPDKTGKRRDNGDNSAVVTQGAEHYLIDALTRTSNGKFFTVMERAALNELAQEREIHELKLRRANLYRVADKLQLQRQALQKSYDQNFKTLNDPDENPNVITLRENLEAQDRQLQNEIEELRSTIRTSLPTLNRAKYVIHGAITDYDTNTATGGIGAKYLGIGGHNRYRKDAVTISMRISEVRTGKTLLSTKVTKALYSVSKQATIFAYVATDSIFEFDAGETENEPGQVAIQEAIELGLYTLIEKGRAKKLW